MPPPPSPIFLGDLSSAAAGAAGAMGLDAVDSLVDTTTSFGALNVVITHPQLVFPEDPLNPHTPALVLSALVRVQRQVAQVYGGVQTALANRSRYSEYSEVEVHQLQSYVVLSLSGKGSGGGGDSVSVHTESSP